MVAPRTISPTALRKVLAHDFRDALDDFTGDVPENPDDYTLQAIDTLLGHLRACETYLVMLRHNARKIERCGGATPILDSTDRWNEFCTAVTDLEIHAVPYSVPGSRGEEWICDQLRTLNAAWVAFMRAERCAAVECSNASDAAANVLPQPTLRERLGRAPLSDDGGMP